MIEYKQPQCPECGFTAPLPVTVKKHGLACVKCECPYHKDWPNVVVGEMTEKHFKKLQRRIKFAVKCVDWSAWIIVWCIRAFRTMLHVCKWVLPFLVGIAMTLPDRFTVLKMIACVGWIWCVYSMLSDWRTNETSV